MQINNRMFEKMIVKVSASEDQLSGGSLDVMDRELQKLLEEELIEPGDHERYSHYVKKEKILESALTGKAVRALCGKKWLPNRNPDKFPICPDCKKIYERMRDE